MAAATLLSVVLLLAGSSAWIFSGSNNGRLKHIQVYMHQISSGPNATAIMAVSSGAVPNSSFGTVTLLDNELRNAPVLRNSSVVGRVQGIMVPLGLVSPPGTQTALSFVFTAGEHAGSSLAIMGPLLKIDGVYERAVVGGTGKFRMSRGYSFVTFVAQATPVSHMYEVNLFLKMDA
jgi:hypothetical protein